MKKVFLGSLLMASLMLGLIACEKEDSSDVNQDKIYTEYEVFYNANTDKTTVIARLRFGSPTGTLLEATDAANITFNGDTLGYNIFYSGHTKEYAGLISTGTFVYTNVDGNQFSNTPPAMDLINFPADFDTIIKSQANTFTWVGNPLNSNERANLYVGTWTWGQDAAFFAYTNGATNIVMGLNNLNNLAVGNSTCYLDRVQEVQVSQGTSEGGVIRTRYRPLNKQVQIVP